MSKKILLESDEGDSFQIGKSAAFMSRTLREIVQEDGADKVISLPNVPSSSLSKAIQYCEKHVDAASQDRNTLKEWDAKFMDVDESKVFDLNMTANYLNISGLRDLTRETAKELVRRKNPIEEKMIRYENPWAFDSDDE